MSMPIVETRPHFRVAADWTSDPDIGGIDPRDRATATFVYFGLLAASRRAEAFGLVIKAKKTVRTILGGVLADPAYVIGVLVEADLCTYDDNTDVLVLTQWGEWQQTEEELTAGRERRSQKAREAANKRWDTERAAKSAVKAPPELPTASSEDPLSMLEASGAHAQACLDMQEEKASEVEKEGEGKRTKAASPAPVLITGNAHDAAAGLVASYWTDHAKQERASKNLSDISDDDIQALTERVAILTAEGLPPGAICDALDAALRTGRTPLSYLRDVARKKAAETPTPSPVGAAGAAPMNSLPGAGRAPSRVLKSV